MASCASNDLPVDQHPSPNTQLLATWYASYRAEGTVPIPVDDSGTMEPYHYDRIVEVYLFRNNGIGRWNRYFFAGNEQLPFTNLGGGGTGDLRAFNYTTSSDGTISLKLTNYQKAPSEDPYLPIERQLTLADGVLQASGIDRSTRMGTR